MYLKKQGPLKIWSPQHIFEVYHGMNKGVFWGPRALLKFDKDHVRQSLSIWLSVCLIMIIKLLLILIDIGATSLISIKYLCPCETLHISMRPQQSENKSVMQENSDMLKIYYIMHLIMAVEITSLFFVNCTSSHFKLCLPLWILQDMLLRNRRSAPCSIYNYRKCESHALPLSAISCQGLT